jgi:hypothetical protein
MQKPTEAAIQEWFIRDWESFPDGPHKIYRVSGNTDSSDAGTALAIMPAIYDKNARQTFTSWKDFARAFRKLERRTHHPRYDCRKDDCETCACVVCTKSMGTQDWFLTVVDPTIMDPTLFVTDNNILVRWLVDIRRWG